MVEEKTEIINELEGIKKELHQLRKKDIKQVLSIIIAIILSLIIGIGSGTYIGLNWDKLHPEKNENEMVSILESKLEKQAKLNTGIYTATAKYTSGNIEKDFPGLLNKVDILKKASTKSFSFVFSGSVEAGIQDLSKTRIEVNRKTNVITVKLPEIEITNINIDYNSIKDTQQTKNIINQITIEDFNNAQKKMQKELKDVALKEDIIKKAEESAIETLSNMFSGVTNGYNLEFTFGH